MYWKIMLAFLVMWPGEIKPIKSPHWPSKTHIFSLALTQNPPTRWCCRMLLAQDEAWGIEDWRCRRLNSLMVSSQRGTSGISAPPTLQGGRRVKEVPLQSRCFHPETDLWSLKAVREKRTLAADVFIYFFQGLQTFRVHYTFSQRAK